jgi:hypothetical protein
MIRGIPEARDTAILKSSLVATSGCPARVFVIATLHVFMYKITYAAP